MQLLGVVGRASNGKSTVAEAIVSHAASEGVRAKSYEISTLILDEAKWVGLISEEKTRSRLSAAEIKTLVDLGRRRRQQFNQDYWLKELALAIEEDAPDVAVIPNIRYENEADFIKSHGGHLIKVTALNSDGSQFIATDRDPNDPTETVPSLLKADYYLTVNRGESALLSEYAVTLYEYLSSLEEK
jgi:hypothetical protein